MLNLFDISLKLNGFPIEQAQKDLAEIHKIPEEEYGSYLNRKKTEIVCFHLEHNLYYKKFFNGAYKNWEDVPVMTKKDFQKPIASRLSEGYPLKKVYVNKTSGSSGDPFIFAKDKYAHALTWANNIYQFGQFGIDFNKSLQARFYGIPLDKTGYYKERFKDLLSHRYRFPIFNLSDDVLENVLKKFTSTKFDYINGYTSSIVLFGKFLKKKNIVLKTVCPTLRCCIVTSEMLFEEDKILLENQFGIPLVNEYGASELDLIAYQNPVGDWKLNSETLYIEILDENNKVLPYGEEGRVVITSLYNKAHPFIRYDIGDIGVISKKSTPKYQVLEKLVGRTNDIALLPSGKKSPGLTFYYVTKSIIEDDGNVKEFIIRQTAIDIFEIDYVSETELAENQIDEIKKAISTYLEDGLTFIFSRKEVLDRSKRGKLKQFVSLLASQDNNK